MAHVRLARCSTEVTSSKESVEDSDEYVYELTPHCGQSEASGPGHRRSAEQLARRTRAELRLVLESGPSMVIISC